MFGRTGDGALDGSGAERVGASLVIMGVPCDGYGVL